jgi:hypothetical protein
MYSHLLYAFPPAFAPVRVEEEAPFRAETLGRGSGVTIPQEGYFYNALSVELGMKIAGASWFIILTAILETTTCLTYRSFANPVT